MTRVKIEPGICGFDATVTAESADQMEVTLRVDGGCEAVQKMSAEPSAAPSTHMNCA
ncbi:MAG: DUF6951 family protein [Acutalibacteraceae bacterium]